MNDNSFFEELQVEFLNESAFLLEQYEESMLGLENGTDPASDLTQIFRVAHSIKGGAAAVGLTDLSKFAHVVEDLLDLLRSSPELVNSNAISILLKSGDELKKRITSLQKGENNPWDTSELVAQLIQITENLHGGGNTENQLPSEPTIVAVPDDFFSNVEYAATVEKTNNVINTTPLPEDHTNHDLLEELLAQMPAEEAAAYRQNVTGQSAANPPPANPVGAQAQPSAEEMMSVSAPVIDINDPDLGKIEIPDEIVLEPIAEVAQTSEVKSDQIAEMQKIAPLVAETLTKVLQSTAPTQAAAPAAKPAAVAATVPPTSVAKPATPTQNKNSESGNGGDSGNKSGKTNKNVTTSIKVDTGRVDSVLDAVGELVVLKNQLVHDETVKNSGNVRLEAIVDQLDKAVRELYEKTLSIRMTPLKSLFLKIQRIVRDVSISLDKPVNLQLMGEETEVERTVFELLNDPLVHLVRNAMDHGVEKRETRKERGKPEVASVVVSAKQSGGNVVIEIVDDGGGINRERVLKKAIEKNLVPPNVDPTTLSDEQVYQFIFAPGFSTADKISDLSGRGVGLDVVKSNIDRVNGKINIHSKPGIGSTFRLTIPLSTAITDGIVVAMDGARYILPIHAIREIVRVLPKDFTNVTGGGRVANIRGSLIPVVDPSKSIGTINWLLNERDKTLLKRREDSLSARREETMLIIIETLNGKKTLPVDDVIGQAQVVVKPVSMGATIPEVAGAAILGDGRTVLILDPEALVSNSYEGAAA